MRTQVAIIGAGPAGLVLAALLKAQGIESVVIEARSRQHIQRRVRAGVLEHPSVELLRSLGLAERLDREGMRHDGVRLRFGEQTRRLDFTELTGRSITIYGQQELVKDLVASRLEAGDPLLFEVSDVQLDDLAGPRPRVTLNHQGAFVQIDCDFVAGCDGFHGVSRSSVPSAVWTTFERIFPFAWLGVLVAARPSSDEIVYAHHADGFALHSMRSPALVRQYLQVPADAQLRDWPTDRIWAELHRRLDDGAGFTLNEGAVIEQSITPLRAFVCEPMQYERLFLLGDAAHIVPPTGAKGMNLAISDAYVLSDALAAHYREGRGDLLAEYSATCLGRVWQTQRFASEMTSLLHRFPGTDPMDERLQLARLDHLTSSEAAATALAQSYVGQPFRPAPTPTPA